MNNKNKKIMQFLLGAFVLFISIFLIKRFWSKGEGGKPSVTNQNINKEVINPSSSDLLESFDKEDEKKPSNTESTQQEDGKPFNTNSLQKDGEEKKTTSIFAVIREIEYGNKLIIVEGEDELPSEWVSPEMELDCEKTLIIDKNGRELEFEQLSEYDVIQADIILQKDFYLQETTQIIQMGMKEQKTIQSFLLNETKKIVSKKLRGESIEIVDPKRVNRICRSISSVTWERRLSTEDWTMDPYITTFYDGEGNVLEQIDIVGPNCIIYSGIGDQGDRYFYRPVSGEYIDNYIERMFGKKYIGNKVNLNLKEAITVSLYNKDKGNMIKVKDKDMVKKILQNMQDTPWKVGKPSSYKNLKWKYHLAIYDKIGRKMESIYIISKNTIVLNKSYYGLCEWKSVSGDIDMDFMDNLCLDPKFDGKVVEDENEMDLSDCERLTFSDPYRNRHVDISDNKIIQDVIYGNTELKCKVKEFRFHETNEEPNYLYSILINFNNEDNQKEELKFEIVSEDVIYYWDDTFGECKWRLLSGKINLKLLKKLWNESSK